MSKNNNFENWRKVTGVGHGQNWGTPTQHPTSGGAWGTAMKQSADGSKSSPSKGLNAAATSFTPGGNKSKK
jgi:hypothetical protein